MEDGSVIEELVSSVGMFVGAWLVGMSVVGPLDGDAKGSGDGLAVTTLILVDPGLEVTRLG